MFDEATHHDLPCCRQQKTRVLSVSAVWCDAHQAWTIYGAEVELAPDEATSVWNVHFNGGPFDTTVELQGHLANIAADLIDRM